MRVVFSLQTIDLRVIPSCDLFPRHGAGSEVRFMQR
jgi:hypothetical protein